MGNVEEGGLGAGRTLLNKTARRSEKFVSTSVADHFVGRHSAGRPGLDFASVGQASDSGSGLAWRTDRPVDSCDHTCWDHSVCHHVSLVVGNIEQPGIRSFVPANQKESRSIQMWPTLLLGQFQSALRECRIDLSPALRSGRRAKLIGNPKGDSPRRPR